MMEAMIAKRILKNLPLNDINRKYLNGRLLEQSMDFSIELLNELAQMLDIPIYYHMPDAIYHRFTRGYKNPIPRQPWTSESIVIF